MLLSGFMTDSGKRRDRNEDALLMMPERNIFAVADGVGGHNRGDVASKKAVSGIREFLNENPLPLRPAGGTRPEAMPPGIADESGQCPLKAYFMRCFRSINENIIAMARSDPALAGMATTAVAAYLDDGVLYLTNIGDSRAYVMRGEEIRQLTEDHSFVNTLVRSGALTKSEARLHPRKNMITQALGIEINIEPDFYRFELQSGDLILLCTDGLSGELTDEEIRVTASSAREPAEKCERLVAAANDRGGNDNITVVCIAVDDCSTD
jgi:protein phosphatase